MKYKTKPIDYTGCNPIIAEHLKRGEAIWCEVQQVATKSYQVWVYSYDVTAKDYFDTENQNWKVAKPIPHKTTL
jgi:hypothetical protein